MCHEPRQRNCSTFAVDASKIAGIEIFGEGAIPVIELIMYPSHGNDPADLGQDILEGKFRNRSSYPITRKANLWGIPIIF